MNNVSILYCRVSRDEQAENYSLPDQERMTREYADQNGFHVLEVLKEDYSGAAIDRPEMQKGARLGARRKI